MDRELGFDLYTLKLFLLVIMTIMVCCCTVSAMLGVYAILEEEILTDIPDWQLGLLWVSLIYIGLFAGVRLVGRSGFSAIKQSAERSELLGARSHGHDEYSGPVDLDKFWG